MVVGDGRGARRYAAGMSEAPAMPPQPMTADDFIAWAMEQDGRYELTDGQIVAMAPERVVHAIIKGNVFRALGDAIAHAGLPCRAFPDGIAVRANAGNVYEPDAFVRCGEPLSGETVTVTDPVIVVEVSSPSTSGRDAGVKLTDYFRIPSVRHYLQIYPHRRLVLHHARPEGAAKVETAFLPGGPLRLDPPGLDLDLDAFFDGA